MKIKLIKQLLLVLLLSFIVVSRASAQANKQVMKVTIPGYPTFVSTDNSMIPVGATGGVLSIVKNADNIDQQFNTAIKNKTPIASLDLVYYDSKNGQLTKNKTIHFTKLIVKSLAPNVNKITAVGFSFEDMKTQ